MRKIDEHLKKLAEAKARVKLSKNNREPNGKATAELEASKDPMGFLRRNKNMSIKGKKGIAV